MRWGIEEVKVKLHGKELGEVYYEFTEYEDSIWRKFLAFVPYRNSDAVILDIFAKGTYQNILKIRERLKELGIFEGEIKEPGAITLYYKLYGFLITDNEGYKQFLELKKQYSYNEYSYSVKDCDYGTMGIRCNTYRKTVVSGAEIDYSLTDCVQIANFGSAMALPFIKYLQGAWGWGVKQDCIDKLKAKFEKSFKP